MDDMTAFDRLLTREVRREAGPSRPVNDAEIFTAITATRSPKWSFQFMLSATRFVVAVAIVALFGGILVAGVLTQQPNDEAVPAMGASASTSPQEAGAMTSSVFALRLTVDGWYDKEIDPDTGFATARGFAEAILPFEWEAASKDEVDAGSIFPLAGSWGSAPDADPRTLGLVTEVWVRGEDVPFEGGGSGISRRSTRIENDGGAWVGRATVPSIGTAGIGIRMGTSFWELIGEGGYEGLTMFLWGDFVRSPELLLGMIVPSDAVPDFPPPPVAGRE